MPTMILLAVVRGEILPRPAMRWPGRTGGMVRWPQGSSSAAACLGRTTPSAIDRSSGASGPPSARRSPPRWQPRSRAGGRRTPATGAGRARRYLPSTLREGRRPCSAISLCQFCSASWLVPSQPHPRNAPPRNNAATTRSSGPHDCRVLVGWLAPSVWRIRPLRAEPGKRRTENRGGRGVANQGAVGDD